MKRRLLSLVLAVGCSLAVSGAAVASEYIMPDYVIIDGISIPKEMILQQDALNAYQKLYDSFQLDSNGDYIYPDDYAGEYIDENFNLVVMLTTDNNAQYETLLNDFDCLDYRTVKYSLNELHEVLKQEIVKISQYTAEKASCYIDVETNSVVIEIAETSLNTTYGLKRSDISSPVRYEYVNNNIELQSANLYGGDVITPILNDDDIGDVTAGICGTYNGQNALLTCGHIKGDVGDPIYYKNTPTIIGTVSRKVFSDGSSGDYAIITLNSNFTSTNLIKHEDFNGVVTTIPITATMGRVAKGSYIYKYGAVSGYTYLQVTDTYYEATSKFLNDDATEYIEYTLHNMTQAKVINGNIPQGGDSGGPYYFYDDGKWVFCGIHSGARSVGIEYYAIFTPYGQVLSTFTAKTS